MKKIIFGLGTISTIAIPVIATVSCGVKKMKSGMPEDFNTNYNGGIGVKNVAGRLSSDILKNENFDISNIGMTLSLSRETKNVLNAYFNSDSLSIGDVDQFYNQYKSMVNPIYKSLVQEVREDNDNYYFKFLLDNVTEGNWLNYKSIISGMINLIEELNSLPKNTLLSFVQMDLNELLEATRNSHPNIYKMISKNFISNDNTIVNNMTVTIAYDKSNSSVVKMCISNGNEHFLVDFKKLNDDIKNIRMELFEKLGIDPNNHQNSRPFGVISDMIDELDSNIEWASKIEFNREMNVINAIIHHEP